MQNNKQTRIVISSEQNQKKNPKKSNFESFYIKIKGMRHLFKDKRMITVSVCRKCGKESKEEEMPLEHSMENRRGKRASDKICSECN